MERSEDWKDIAEIECITPGGLLEGGDGEEGGVLGNRASVMIITRPKNSEVGFGYTDRLY